MQPHLPLPPLLAALRSHLGILVDEEGWQRIAAVGAGLAPIWGGGHFEARLLGPDPRVDFEVEMREPAEKARLAAALAAGTPLGMGEAVEALLEEWTGPHTLLAARSLGVFVEWDLPAGPPRSPFLYFRFVRTMGRSAPALPPAELTTLVGRCQDLLGTPRRPAQHAALEGAVRALPVDPPRDARLSYFGLPGLARGGEAVRLVAQLPPAEIWSWLAGLGWKGAADDWERTRALFRDEFSHLQVSLDIEADGTMGPLVGVEHYLPGRPDPRLARRHAEFLGQLIELGLASPERAAAACGWLGEETLRLPGAPWPVHLQRKPSVKLLLDDRGGLLAKSYLTFGARYFLL